MMRRSIGEAGQTRWVLARVMAAALLFPSGVWSADGGAPRVLGCGEDLQLAYHEISIELDQNPKDYALQILAGVVQEMRGFAMSAREHYGKVLMARANEKVFIECGSINLRAVPAFEVAQARLGVMDGGKKGEVAKDAPEKREMALVTPEVVTPPSASMQDPRPAADEVVEETAEASTLGGATESPNAAPTLEVLEPSTKEEPLVREEVTRPLPAVDLTKGESVAQGATTAKEKPSRVAEPNQEEPQKEEGLFNLSWWGLSEEPESKPETKAESKPFFQLWEPPKKLPRISEVASEAGSNSSALRRNVASPENPVEPAQAAPPEPVEEALAEPGSAEAPQSRQTDAAPRGFLVQVESHLDEARAEKSLRELEKRFADLRGDYGWYVQPAEQSGTGTVYRVVAGGFDTNQSAQAFCMALQKREQGCFVRK